MLVRSVTLENYGSFFGKTYVQLAGRGITFVQGRNEDESGASSNGAGKSSIFQALEWGLYGKTSKNDNADTIINESAKGNSAVTVLLDDDGIPISIQRFRKVKGKNGLRLWVGAVIEDLEDAESEAHQSFERTNLDANATQCAVDEILGLDHAVFRAAVFRAQEDTTSFAEATDSERKEILTKILQLEPIDVWLERAKREESALEYERTTWVRKIDEILGQLRVLERLDYSQQRAAWERERETRLEHLRSSYIAFQEFYEKAVGLCCDEELLRARSHELGKALPQEPVDSSTQYTHKLGELESRRKRSIEDLSNLQTTVSRAVAKSNTICESCLQTISPKHTEQYLGLLNSRIGAIEQELRNIVEEIETTKGYAHEAKIQYEAAIKERQEQSKTIQIELASIDKQLLLNQEYGREAKRIQRSLDEIQERGESVKAERNPFEQLEREANQKISLLQNEKEQFELEIAKCDSELNLVSFWVKALGPKGLKSYILESRLDELNRAANHWLEILTKGTCWIELEAQTQNKSTKNLAEKLNLRVFLRTPQGKVIERSYRSWSGGERARIALSIDFALSQIVTSRATKAWELLILDEVFKHLDDQGRSGVVELLRYLEKEKSSIFVIDHHPVSRSEVQNMLFVRKKNGRSEVVS